MTTIFTRVGLAASLALMAACASTPETTTTETAEVVRPSVPQTVQPTGPVPGSAEDFEVNAGQRVFFGYDQYNLTNEAQSTLARQAAWLKEYPQVSIRMIGNADERGTREYNLALGARRAQAAKAYLVGLGVDASRITTISYGKERPIDADSSPNAWAKNRNATTMLVSVGA